MKLVRDYIPAIMKKKGLAAKFYIADEKEYFKRLKEKLIEEVFEYIETESTEEILDILEVVYSIIKLKKFSRSEIEKMRLKKNSEKGSFDKKIILINK